MDGRRFSSLFAWHVFRAVFRAGCLSSPSPLRIARRDTPVARATMEIPRGPIASASAAAAKRRVFSSMCFSRRMNRRWIASSSAIILGGYNKDPQSDTVIS